MKNYQSITVERDAAVAILTLNAPDTLNALTFDMADEICDALATVVEGDRTVRALILTGAGRGFCSGQNLKAEAIDGEGLMDTALDHYLPIFTGLRGARVPVICAVNGVAAGGGFSLALAGDVIVAARSARFIQVFSRIGLVPDIGSTYLLPQRIGRARALKAMMTNDPIGAEQALDWGMVSDVVDDGNLMPAALDFAKRLADGPTQTLVATRALVDEADGNDFATQFRRELEVQETVSRSADGREGVTAFVEKRPARFTGQ